MVYIFLQEHGLLLEWVPSLVIFGVVVNQSSLHCLFRLFFHFLGLILLLSQLYIAAFSSGFGAVPWVTMSEVLNFSLQTSWFRLIQSVDFVCHVNNWEVPPNIKWHIFILNSQSYQLWSNWILLYLVCISLLNLSSVHIVWPCCLRVSQLDTHIMKIRKCHYLQ